MSLYTKARRHINMVDVKKRHKIKEEKERKNKKLVEEGRKILREYNSPKFSDWRWDLKEGMTTAALSTTTLPATGDTVISQVDGYQTIFAGNGGSLSGTDLSYSVREMGTVTYISGTDYTYSRSATTNPIDTTRITQIKFSISKTAQPLGVDSWTDVGDGKTYNDNISVTMYSPFLDIDDDTGIFTTDATTGDYTFDIPEILRGRTDVVISFTQYALAALEGEPTSGTAAATFYTPSFQRTVPVTLVVSLDDPTASAFIRTEPLSSNLSPAEREKKLKEMLDASDEYLAKQFGDQFPGTKAAPPKPVEMPKTFAQMKLDKDVAWLKSMGKSFTQGYLSGLSSSEANAIRRAMGMPVSKSSNPLNDVPDHERAWLQSMGPAFTQGYLGLQPKAPITPPADASKPSLTPQQLANIENSLKQLEIDKQRDKEAALRRNIEFAGNLAMDALTLASLLSPVPGDEAAILAARGGGQIVKQGSGQIVKQTTKQTTKSAITQTAKDAPQIVGQLADDAATLSRALGKSSSPAERALARKIDNAINDGSEELVRSLLKQGRSIMRGGYRETMPPKQGPAAPKPYKIDPRRRDPRNLSGLPRNLSQSYEPQGQVLSEKKLKSPKEVLDKIPGYYDGKPAPLGFPVEPPPEMVNGFHKDLVDGKKVANRFNKLDPQSAKAMPLTGNPHIDKKVKAARKKPK